MVGAEAVPTRKSNAFEIAPSEFATVMVTVLGTSKSVADIWAVSLAVDINEVGRLDPFQSTDAPGRNPLPVTVRTKAGLPVETLGGSTPAISDAPNTTAPFIVLPPLHPASSKRAE